MKNEELKECRTGVHSSFIIHHSSFRRAARTVVLALTLGAAAGCTDFAGYDLDMLAGRVPWLSTMRSSVAYYPYDMPRLPAEGAVPAINPMGDIPEPYTQTELDAVAATLVNPLQPTAEVLARGALVYERHCWACHGPAGNGQGPVVGPGRFPFAPAVGSGAVARSEGYIYAITDVGRGLMPAYGARIPHLDRWAVSMYVARLQAGGAVPGVEAAPATLVAPGTAPTQAPTPPVLPMPVDSPAPATLPVDSPAQVPPAAPGSR